MTDVHRRIHFLKVVSEVYNFGELLQEIDTLRGAQMYSFIDGSGGGVFIKSVEHAQDMYKVTIGRLRMNNLPSVGRQGERMTEQLAIAEDQGLVECTHFIYFERSGILAMEYNHHGPKASTLEWHMTDKANAIHGEPPQLQLQPIFDENVMRVLSEGYELKLIRMKVPKEKIGNLAQFDSSIYGAFENAKNFGEGAEVEIVIRMKTGRKQSLKGDRLLEKLKGLPGDLEDTFGTLKLRVKRPDEPVRAVDLLEGKFVVDILMPTAGRSNEVDAAAIFLEMQEAYQQKREELRRMSEYEQLS